MCQATLCLNQLGFMRSICWSGSATEGKDLGDIVVISSGREQAVKMGFKELVGSVMEWNVNAIILFCEKMTPDALQ